jgi:hypothetical protein
MDHSLTHLHRIKGASSTSDSELHTYDIVALSTQSLFFLAFIIPASIILITRWRHLDYFSISMIFIYMADLTLKLVFFIADYFVSDTISPDDNIEKALLRSFLFLINSLFLMSLHMLVQKLVTRYFHYKSRGLQELADNQKRIDRFIYWSNGISLALISIILVMLVFVWRDIYS